MIIYIKQVLVVLLLLVFNKVCSQDVYFDQQQLNRFSTNPAHSSLNKQSSLFLHYRNHLPSFAGGFKTYNIWYNQAFKKSNNGISMGITQDLMPGSVFVSNRVDLVYAYKVRVGFDKFLSAGLQGGFLYNTINTAGLIPATSEPISAKSSFETRFSAGFMMSDPNWNYGLALNDISSLVLKNKNSLSSLGLTMEVERKINLYSLEQTSWEKGTKLNPSLIVRYYLNQYSYTIGSMVEKRKILAGLWIRNGLPFYVSDIIVGAGYTINNVRLFYTYGYNVNSLVFSGLPKVSHEISVQFLFDPATRKPNKGPLKCPPFPVNEAK